ncbi:DUF4190 domain-containing protein [Candidatus Pacearchaeota archaeon]|nr:DUF4190 domain-containing protein [Candidatus Pacearchaeota archaeon]
MRKLNNLRFDRSYGETDYRNYVHINAVSGTSITFSTTEDVDFVSLPVFISPDLNDLILKPEPPGAKSTKSKWWLYSIIIAIILIIGGLGYFFINKWYKNKYEIHLFKTKNNLFNILSYINNSKRKGMPDIEIRTRLKKSGWTWEQIDYSMKKYYGEKIFMAGKGQRIGKKASDYNLNPRPSSKSIDLKKYNTLSIVAFIFIFLFPLVGLIMGIMALSQIKKTGERGRWMALTSVIAPVILIIIGLVLFMIIFN